MILLDAGNSGIKAARGFPPGGRQLLRSGRVGLPRRIDGLLHFQEQLVRPFQRCQVGGEPVAHGGQLVRLAPVLARQIAQGKKPGLHRIQAAAVQVDVADQGIQGKQCFRELNLGALQRHQHRLEPVADLVRRPLQRARGAA